MSAHRRDALFATTHGHVRRCDCCSQLEVRFGNALLALLPEDLPHVLDQLRAAESHAGDVTASGGRGEVTLLLGDSGSGWVFDRAEAAELHRLVAGAGLLLGLDR
jgi:hypothetical protein